jgi:hypothetical protein
LSGDLSVSLEGSALAYIEDRVKALFGKDQATVGWNQLLARRMRLALEQARWVKCVGMDSPVAIDAIYQPLSIRIGMQGRSPSSRALQTDVLKLMQRSADAVIFAGPGRGKSTLLNWLYCHLQNSPTYDPFLFILRSENAVDDLESFVARLVQRKPATKKRPILFVDGYDEVNESTRKAVSNILADFRAEGVGNFYLTCRTFYDVYELKVSNYQLSEFSREDVVRFISSFATAYDVKIDAEALARQLEERELWTFAAHPLMLTLICILKTGPLPELPHRSIDLLGRAFETLTLRWDQQRGIHRQSAIPVDGYDRIRILRRVAFKMRSLIVSQESMETYVREYLRLIHRPKVDARTVLQEIAQWYGVLVPTEESRWQFIHRSIHDYLAAQFWLESGRFDPSKVEKWNYRAAYAACISGDATPSMVRALHSTEDIQAFSECLYNQAPFRSDEVAQAVISHFGRFRPFTHERLGSRLTVETTQDFFHLCPDSFLVDMLEAAFLNRNAGDHLRDSRRFEPHDVIVAYSLDELRQRKAKLKPEYLQRDLKVFYGSSDFTMQIGLGKDPTIFTLKQILA